MNTSFVLSTLHLTNLENSPLEARAQSDEVKLRNYKGKLSKWKCINGKATNMHDYLLSVFCPELVFHCCFLIERTVPKYIVFMTICSICPTSHLLGKRIFQVIDFSRQKMMKMLYACKSIFLCSSNP